MPTSDILDLYGELKGSRGQARFQLRPKLLDELCALAKPQLGDRLEKFSIVPGGANRFSVRAKLSNSFFHAIGNKFLTVLSENGIEIQITQPIAVAGKPWEGTLDAGLLGKGVLYQLAGSINDGLQVGIVVQVNASFFGETRITFDPFPILRKYLPARMGGHITLVKLQTTADSFFVDFNWEHAGLNHNHKTKGNPMDAQIQTFIDNMIRNQFADFKGSWASLHLELSEKMLNDLAKLLIAQKSTIPYLGLVNSAHVKGGISMDIKLNA